MKFYIIFNFISNQLVDTLFLARNYSTFFFISYFHICISEVLIPIRSKTSIATKSGAENIWVKLSNRAGFLS